MQDKKDIVSVRKEIRLKPNDQQMLKDLYNHFRYENKKVSESAIMKMGLSLLYFKTFKDDL